MRPRTPSGLALGSQAAGCRVQIGILGLSEAQAADWGKGGGGTRAGGAMGPSHLRQLPGLAQGTVHPSWAAAMPPGPGS